MWSVSASALVPSSVTVCPLTETTPEVINSSALRREAMPAAAMIFCNRSCAIFATLLPAGFREERLLLRIRLPLIRKESQARQSHRRQEGDRRARFGRHQSSSQTLP